MDRTLTPESNVLITGVTGLAIIRALLAGQRGPVELAKLRDDRCGRSAGEIARALYGNWRAEHLFALKQAVALYECYQRQIAECDQRIEEHLQTFPDKSAGQPLPSAPLWRWHACFRPAPRSCGRG